MAGALAALNVGGGCDADSDIPSSAETPVFCSIAPPQFPWRFANFEVRREIASGGMGTVYEAEDLRLGRAVALKMIRSFILSTPEEKMRFKAEAEAVAALDHSNIIPIYQVGEAQGQPYFTMKLIDGGTLAARLKTGPMMPRPAARLMAEIARAVHHAHQRGVLHRDLKPGNILLDAEDHPYLTDFGLAKLADRDQMLTISKAQVGTPQYMSPEQAAGRTREISTESDVWSLGAMLYEMLSGRLPFEGTSSPEVLRNILDTEPSSLYPRIQGIDRDLATIVFRCLEKDPLRRPPSAEFLAQELERWLRGDPIQSRAISAGERSWKWVRRHKTASASIAFACISLIVGTGVSAWQAARATSAQESAEQHAADAQRLAASASAARLEAERQLAEAEAITKVITDTLADMQNFSSGPTIDRQKLVQELIKRVEALPGDSVRKARLFAALGKTLPEEEGAEVLHRAVVLAEAALGRDDPLLWELRLQEGLQRALTPESRAEGVKEMRGIAEWARLHLPPEDPRRVTANAVLGRYLSATDENQEAASVLKEVCQILQTHPESFNQHSQIIFRADYANALLALGRKDEAVTVGRESFRLALAAKNDVPLAAARGAIAHAEFCRKAGLLSEAAESADESLKLYWQVGGPLANSSERALNLELAVRREMGDQTQLFALYQTAIHEFDLKLGLTHPRTVAQVRDYARALLSANRWAEADKLCGDWLDRVRSPNGVLPLECEGILRAQAEVLRKGTDLERAESACRELVTLLQRYRPNDMQHYVDLSNLAEILIRRHKFGEAGEVAEKAIQGLDAHPAGDPALTRQHLERARDRLHRANSGLLQPAS